VTGQSGLHIVAVTDKANEENLTSTLEQVAQLVVGLQQIHNKSKQVEFKLQPTM